MKKSFIIIVTALICFSFVACANSNSYVNNEQTTQLTKIKTQDDSTSLVSNKNTNSDTKMEKDNSVDIITNETTTSNEKSDVSDEKNKNFGTDTDNSQVDIDSIIGGDYF